MYAHELIIIFVVSGLIGSLAVDPLLEQAAQALGGGLPTCSDGHIPPPPCKKGGLRGKVSAMVPGTTTTGASNMTSCSEGKIIGATKNSTSNMTTGNTNDTWSTERNKEIVRAFVEQVLNLHNLTAIDQYVASNFVGYEKKGVIDREGLRQFLTDFILGFPDVSATIENIIAEDNKVVVFLNISGTHNGQYYEIPPTGKHLSARVATLIGLSDNGLIVEECAVEDNIDMLRGLGLIALKTANSSQG